MKQEQDDCSLVSILFLVSDNENKEQRNCLFPRKYHHLEFMKLPEMQEKRNTKILNRAWKITFIFLPEC